MSIDGFAKCLVVGGVVLVGASAFAQAPAQEKALAISAQDPQLQWEPCPTFMPAGCSLAVLHGDSEGANADVLLKVPAKAVIPRHWHTSAERMVLIAGEMSASYEGQSPFVLKPGMYIYGPAKLPHSATCNGSAPCLLFIAFESALDAFPSEPAAK